MRARAMSAAATSARYANKPNHARAHGQAHRATAKNQQYAVIMAYALYAICARRHEDKNMRARARQRARAHTPRAHAARRQHSSSVYKRFTAALQQRARAALCAALPAYVTSATHACFTHGAPRCRRHVYAPRTPATAHYHCSRPCHTHNATRHQTLNHHVLSPSCRQCPCMPCHACMHACKSSVTLLHTCPSSIVTYHNVVIVTSCTLFIMSPFV